MKKVIVIGLDGLEPTLVDALLARGELPNLARLRDQGGYARVATTCPAQTPVAWSTFATGLNPGGHGIYDFIRRDPKRYLPDLSFNRYEQKNAFLPPQAVNQRQGTPFWEHLGKAGISSTVIRCPCTFPPDKVRGRILAGMGVPDVRGGIGTSTYYTSLPGVKRQESEAVVEVQPDAQGVVTLRLIGPRNPKTKADLEFPLTVQPDPGGATARLVSDGQPKSLPVKVGEWSDWLAVKFKAGLLQSVRGAVRFYLGGLSPNFELYASPVNFDTAWPMFPISAPQEYAQDLADKIGRYYTLGMVEDHAGLNNGRFGEEAFLHQCSMVMDEREKMLFSELDRRENGFTYCLFDTPDRVQHMFWRYREPNHPANKRYTSTPGLQAIEDIYRRCDQVVGRVLTYVDPDTLLIVLSDHGFNSFQRGFELNTWLYEQGLLALKPGVEPGEEAGDFFQGVDWGRTKAYALGLGSLYLNLAGREAEGTVAPADAEALAQSICTGLRGHVDPERGVVAVRGVVRREEVYQGNCLGDAPDLIVHFAPSYRVSWATALGGLGSQLFEDNVKRWSGDHIIDPALVPGVLFMNQPFQGEGARLLDLAPTILHALGVPAVAGLEGRRLNG